MHTIESTVLGCDIAVMFDAHRVVVEIDSADGVNTSSDITLDELTRMVRGQAYQVRVAQWNYIHCREIICESCGRDKNWDTSACTCPGCYSFSTRMPCQFLCNCA